MIRTRRVQLAAAVLGVVAVSSLSGCGTMQAGSAVIIGGQRTTDGQIQAQVNQFDSFTAAYGLPATNGATVAQSQIDLLLESAIWQKVADSLGLKVTPAEVSRERAGIVANARQNIAQSTPGFKGSDDEAIALADAQSQNPSGIAPSQAGTFVTTEAVVNTVVAAVSAKLGLDPTDQNNQQAIAGAVIPMLDKAAAQIKVKVSPRYGAYDPTNRSVDSAAPAWIRTATAASAPAAPAAPAQ